jgi:hypothetical protein
MSWCSTGIQDTIKMCRVVDNKRIEHELVRCLGKYWLIKCRRNRYCAYNITRLGLYISKHAEFTIHTSNYIMQRPVRIVFCATLSLISSIRQTSGKCKCTSMMRGGGERFSCVWVNAIIAIVIKSSVGPVEHVALVVWVEVVRGMVMKRRESGIRRVTIRVSRVFKRIIVLGRG